MEPIRPNKTMELIKLNKGMVLIKSSQYIQY